MSKKEVPRPGLLRHCLAGRIRNAEAAAALRLSVRQVQRLKHGLKTDGVQALVHGLRGRRSNRRLPDERAEQVRHLMTTTYAGFNDRHLTEKVQEVEQVHISRASVRRLRVALGQPAQRPRRAPLHRSRRPRAEAVGRLVQVDGSRRSDWSDWSTGRKRQVRFQLPFFASVGFVRPYRADTDVCGGARSGVRVTDLGR